MTRPLLIDVAEGAGVTYRQADHWVRRGYIRTRDLDGSDFTGGSGNRRYLDDAEVDVLRVMVRLVNLGFAPATAAHLARSNCRLTDLVARAIERLNKREKGDAA